MYAIRSQMRQWSRVALVLLTGTVIAYLLVDHFIFFERNVIDIPFSDHWAVFDRYRQLQDGTLNLLHFIIDKHGDHYHAVVFALSYLDIHLFHGSGALLFTATSIFTLLSIGILFVAVWKSSLFLLTKCLSAIFIVAWVLSARATELWMFPFQVVLASFRFFLLVTVLLLSLGLMLPSSYRKLWFVTGAFVCAIVTAFSHGAGVTIWPIFLLFSLLFRSREGVLFTVIGTAVYLYVELVVAHHVGTFSFSNLFGVIQHQWRAVTYYAVWIIGDGVTARLPILEPWTLAIGGTAVALGITCTALLTSRLVSHKREWPNLFFILLFIASLFGVVLVPLLYLSIGPVNSPEQFVSTRHFIHVAGVWIGVLLMIGILCSQLVRIQWRYAALLPSTALLILLTIGIMRSTLLYRAFTPAYINTLRVAKASLQTGIYDAELVRFLFQPSGPDIGYLHFLQANKLSFYRTQQNPSLFVNGLPKDAITGAVYSIYNYSSGLYPELLFPNITAGYRVYGYFSDPTLRRKTIDRRTPVYLLNERNEIIGYGALSNHPPLLTEDNFDATFYYNNHPDVKYNAWEHYYSTGRLEGRIARPKQYVKKAKIPFIGFISATAQYTQITPVLRHSTAVR